MNRRPELYKSPALPAELGRHTLHLSECLLWGITPNILTVCNGVGQGSTLNIQRGLIPNVQDNDGPVAEWHLWLERLKFLTPPAGFEPATQRLTVVCTTAVLQRIVCLFFFDGLEVKTIISFLHIVNVIHIFSKSHILEMLVNTFHLSYEEKEIDRSSWSPTKCIIVHKRRKDNDSSRIRTYDRLLRRQLLYPAELLSHVFCICSNYNTYSKKGQAK